MTTEITGLTASMHVVLHAASFGGSGHPNKMTFKGVLVRLDEPSNKPPGGADGHRIMLPSNVAKKRLSTLIGMGLNYSPSLDAHAQRRKVGVIEDAGIDGRDLWVKGTIWKHDFPEAEEDLKQHGLGMSMELGDVKVEDPKADVWKLEDCCFLGGTILWKDKAAYHNTRAIAAAKQQGGTMAKVLAPAKKPAKKVEAGVLDEAKIAKIAASAAASAVGTVLASTLKRQTELMEAMATKIDAFSGDDEEDDSTVNASGDGDDADITADADMEEVDASKKGEEDDEDEEEEDDEDELDATSSENKPGSENSDAKNHGSDTTEDDDIGTKVSESITGSSKTIKSLKKKLAASEQGRTALQAQVDTLTKQMKRLTKQVSAAADRTVRRTISSETVGLLGKSNINASSLIESGQKLSVTDVDAVIASAEQATGVKFSTEQRISTKSRLFKEGLMDEGRVDRGFVTQ